MDLLFHLVPQRLVDQLVLLHHGFACEGVGHDLRLEVLAITRNVGLRAGKSLLNQLFNLFGLHRYYQVLSTRIELFQGRTGYVTRPPNRSEKVKNMAVLAFFATASPHCLTNPRIQYRLEATRGLIEAGLKGGQTH